MVWLGVSKGDDEAIEGRYSDLGKAWCGLGRFSRKTSEVRYGIVWQEGVRKAARKILGLAPGRRLTRIAPRKGCRARYGYVKRKGGYEAGELFPRPFVRRKLRWSGSLLEEDHRCCEIVTGIESRPQSYQALIFRTRARHRLV